MHEHLVLATIEHTGEQRLLEGQDGLGEDLGLGKSAEVSDSREDLRLVRAQPVQELGFKVPHAGNRHVVHEPARGGVEDHHLLLHGKR